LRRLLEAGWTQQKISDLIGSGQSQVSKMLDGREPGHRAGECIYILFAEMFRIKNADGSFTLAKPPLVPRNHEN
jgi:predicted transcriptional regulator